MSKRKLTSKIIKIDSVDEELKLIPHTSVYCTRSGKFYVQYGENELYPLKPIENPVNHYVYIGITYDDGKRITKRAHRLIAQAFIPNPNNYTVVGHLNNIKSDNRVENLYWTTVQENTQKAYDDGLAKNDKGFDDSQSMPIDVYDINKNFIETCGSISEASRKYHISKHGIVHQCTYKPKKIRKGYYYRYSNDVL